MKMAEQNMMGFAAGMAREGFEPWIHTFAVFIYRRPFDQMAMSIAYPNLPVRFVAFLPGITHTGWGYPPGNRRPVGDAGNPKHDDC
jgi:transketolase